MLAASSLLAASALAASPAKGVQVVPDETQRRVDITIDGKPFTSYIWPTTLKKPVLYPIMDADGVTLTRGFPPRPGERVDHPHHVGLWFNYARVNNFDFWNNSEAIKPENHAKMGTIVFDKILSASSGPRTRRTGRALDVDRRQRSSDPRGDHALRLLTATARTNRVIDRMATLKALDHVVFEDEKDGMLGHARGQLA